MEKEYAVKDIHLNLYYVGLWYPWTKDIQLAYRSPNPLDMERVISQQEPGYYSIETVYRIR